VGCANLRSMKRQLTINAAVIGCLAVLAVAPTYAATDGKAMSPACGPVDAHTVLETNLSRIYVSRIYPTGSREPKAFRTCLHRPVRDMRLVAPAVQEFNTIKSSLGPFALASRRVAYGWNLESTDTNRAGVLVRNLQNRRELRRAPALNCSRCAWEEVRDIGIDSVGDVAWIGEGWLGSPVFGPGEFRQVESYDSEGVHLLDEGLAIDRKSLVVRGRHVSWKHGAELRTATLR
jgi:hypothetical protein